MDTNRAGILLVAAALALAGCKKNSAPEDGGRGAGVEAAPPAAPPIVRFVSRAELRRDPRHAELAPFVLSDDDLDESSAAGSRVDEMEEVSPDRPPSDLTVTRLALPGEVTLLSYEENCGDGLEDQRNLNYVILERAGAALRELQRIALCGEERRGATFDVIDLTGDRQPKLVVRSWVVDPTGASEYALRVYAATAKGLDLLVKRRDDFEDALRFQGAYPRVQGKTLIEIGVAYAGADGGPERLERLRYSLSKGQLVRAK